jgi:hypothetical protein
VTLAVDKELSRVEAALAAEEQRQSSLIQEFSSKKVELSLRIQSLESELTTTRTQSAETESYYAGQLSRKEADVQELLASARQEQAALMARFEAEKADLSKSMVSLRTELQSVKESSVQKDVYYNATIDEMQTESKAELAKEQQKQSELWVVTLAVEAELTKVETALAAERERQAALVKDSEDKKAELSLRIQSLESNLQTARSQTAETEIYYTGQLSQKEAEVQKALKNAEVCAST